MYARSSGHTLLSFLADVRIHVEHTPLSIVRTYAWGPPDAHFTNSIANEQGNDGRMLLFQKDP
jgi:hypothetical protein